MTEWTPQELLPIMPPSVQCVVGRGVRTEGEVVRLRGIPQIVEHDPWLDARPASRRVQLEKLVVVLAVVDEHRDVAALARQAGAAAPRDDRDVVRSAHLDGRDHVVRVARDDDADGDLPVVRGVGRVQGPAPGVEAHFSAHGVEKVDREALGVGWEPVLGGGGAPGRGDGALADEGHAVVHSRYGCASDRLSSRPMPGRAAIRLQQPVARLDGAVEEQPLDADVVVEPLEMNGGAGGAREVRVEGGGAMGRERGGMRLAEGSRDPEAGRAEAACGISLEDVDGSGFQQPSEGEGVPAVLTGGNRHARRSPVAEQPQAIYVVGADGLLEPGHAALSERRGGRSGTMAFIGAVAIHEQLHRRADRGPRHVHPAGIVGLIAADLHLHEPEAVGGPAPELLAEAGVVV